MTTPSTSFYTDFIPVNRKKRKNKSRPAKEPLLAIIQRLRDELLSAQDNDWLPQCQQIITESFVDRPAPEQIICLGLGSPAASPNARAQLAFLIVISQYLHIDSERISLYDPVFTADDNALFRSLHMNVLSENKNALYALDQPTLCFMPHCDMELYDNIIKANWSRRRIPYLLLIANRLMDYIDSNPRHKLKLRAPFLLALAPALECRAFPVSTQWPTAFNNTAVQVFGRGELQIEGLPD